MELIFLIYGLAFFLLGFAILYYPKKDSAFRLADKLNFVGWFGILHGINEWLDLMKRVNAMDASRVWQICGLITLPVSFLALIYFGASVISTQKKNCLACKFLTPVLIVIWAALFWFGEHSSSRWDILSRYILCFPGALLTGLALFVNVPETKGSPKSRLAVNLKVAGVAFIAYSLLAGLVVNDASFFPASILNYSLFKSFGVPVQVFRSLCAVVVAYNLIRVLEVFHLEMQRSVLDSEMRFRTVVNTAPVTLFIEDQNHTIAFLEGRGLVELDILPADAVGKLAEEVFSSLPQIPQHTQRVFSSNEKITDIISSREHFYELFLAPLCGKVGGVIGVIIDITAQKKAQSDLEKYRTEMEKSKTLAAIGALSAEIADRIATPLHDSKVSLMKSLGGMRKLIGARDVKEDIQLGLDKIADAIQTLDGFCAKANLPVDSKSEPIDLYPIVQRVLSVFRESAQHRMVRITTEGADIFPAMHISSREIEQVLYALVETVIQSADGTRMHDLTLCFSMQKTALHIRFLERCLADSVHTAEKSPAKLRMVLGKKEQDFGFSVLKGIIEAYSGVITTQPDPHNEVLYEIQLPLAKS